jgi:hypothetical protein
MVILPEEFDPADPQADMSASKESKTQVTKNALGILSEELRFADGSWCDSGDILDPPLDTNWYDDRVS